MAATDPARPPVDCHDCRHFRQAPYEAKRDACYHPEHMNAKQGAAYLDEQQVPGNHEAINLRGDCAEFEARPKPASLWTRLFAS